MKRLMGLAMVAAVMLAASGCGKADKADGADENKVMTEMKIVTTIAEKHTTEKDAEKSNDKSARDKSTDKDKTDKTDKTDKKDSLGYYVCNGCGFWAVADSAGEQKMNDHCKKQMLNGNMECNGYESKRSISMIKAHISNKYIY